MITATRFLTVFAFCASLLGYRRLQGMARSALVQGQRGQGVLRPLRWFYKGARLHRRSGRHTR